MPPRALSLRNAPTRIPRGNQASRRPAPTRPVGSMGAGGAGIMAAND
jgi:hypothetical protein